MRSNLLTTPRAAQLELAMAPPASRAEISDAVVAVQPNFTAAINLCISASGLEDKEIYIPLKVDAGHWTRVRQGKAHFPVDQLEALMMLCGNDVPLRWLARRRGFNLLPREDEKDQRMRLLEIENGDLRKEIETLAKYGVIKKPA